MQKHSMRIVTANARRKNLYLTDSECAPNSYKDS